MAFWSRRRDSMRVQAWCVSEDSVYLDQYCSCNISIVYSWEVGSLSMLCVCCWFLWRLHWSIVMFCSSLRVVFIRGTWGLCSFRGVQFSFSPHPTFCILGTMLDVPLRILSLWLGLRMLWPCGLLLRSYCTPLSFCTLQLCVRSRSSCSIEWCWAVVHTLLGCCRFGL